MSDRHEKWVRVEPGHVISAGQPYRWEHNPASDGVTRAAECVYSLDITADETAQWFIDSSWKPPLVLPTEPTWGIAVRNNGMVLAQWSRYDDQFVGNSNRANYGSHVNDVLDFIPLTDEQVQRIEAAR